jgi:hypothetical protein
MRKTIFQSFYLILISAVFASGSFLQAQVRPYRATDRQVENLLTRLEQRTDLYRRSMDAALDNSRLQGSDTEDMFMSYVTEFENATDRLRRNFDDRRSVASDVEEVLNRASFINSFMQRNRISAVAQRDWTNIRADLNTLASYYNVSWNWNSQVPTNNARPYRVSDATVQNLLTRIEANTDLFRRQVDRTLDRSRVNNTVSEDVITNYITDFENATDRLKQRFDARQSVAADVEEVLSRANGIENLLSNNRFNNNVQRTWSSVKSDLNMLAGYYSVSWDWNRTYPMNPTNTGGRLPYTVTDRQVQALISNIETRTDAYRRDITSALRVSTIGGTRSESALLSYIADFENATDRLKNNFNSRNSTSQDVTEVLNRAYYIDSFMRDYRFNTNVERNWTLIRSDLNTLSNYYSVAWNWDRQYEPPSRFDEMITGTYRLNLNESDNVREVVNRALNSYNANQRDNLRDNLERRLQSPDMLAIEKRGNEVTIASTTAPQITFTADGTSRSEPAAGGRNIQVTARTTYDGVGINYEGDRMRDFYVNFMPMSNGKLRVVRRIYLENRNETITVASVYDKVNQTAQWSTVNRGGDINTGGNYNDFVIPNGTQITARLDNLISTKDSQDGDRFTMTVTSPSQYNGAVISGRVLKSESSGRVTGRANISLDFDTIRLRNGQTYRFAGIIDGVTSANGENVSVNNEGTVRDGNQTTRTVTRAGIGAALGALIGAIAGGGEGAAIGAAIGAGAGAGTIFIQGRDNLELGQGSEFRITSSAPANVGNRY